MANFPTLLISHQLHHSFPMRVFKIPILRNNDPNSGMHDNITKMTLSLKSQKNVGPTTWVNLSWVPAHELFAGSIQ